jgi:hypothetical protein
VENNNFRNAKLSRLSTFGSTGSTAQTAEIDTMAIESTLHVAARSTCSGVCSGIRRLSSMVLKRLAESFHLEAGAKQREQAPQQHDSALDR